MKKRVHKKTYAEGASDERDAILKYVRRQLKGAKGFSCSTCVDGLESVAFFITRRTMRFNRKPGGLGKV